MPYLVQSGINMPLPSILRSAREAHHTTVSNATNAVYLELQTSQLLSLSTSRDSGLG
jgi:hypothetical protein